MKSLGLRINATVCVSPADQLSVPHPLTAGWGPVIVFNDKQYIGRVLECEHPIEPGKCGQAVVGIMNSQPDALGLREGSVFELRDGPNIVVATATVVSFVIV